MRRALTLVPAVLAVILAGCGTIRKLSDDDLASYLNTGAQVVVSHGVDFLMDKYPDKKVAILKDITAVNVSIKSDVLPVFAGANVGEITLATVQDVLQKLDTKVSPTIKTVITSAVSAISGLLPQKPGDKIPERTKKAIVGVFTGISTAIDEILADEASATPPPAPAPAAPPK